MTKDGSNARKQAARELAAAEQIPYTEALRRMGLPPVARDAFDEGQFPDDDYDLVPRSYADIDPALQEPAIVWGAAKAHIHLRRRRAADPHPDPDPPPD